MQIYDDLINLAFFAITICLLLIVSYFAWRHERRSPKGSKSAVYKGHIPPHIIPAPACPPGMCSSSPDCINRSYPSHPSQTKARHAPHPTPSLSASPRRP